MAASSLVIPIDRPLRIQEQPKSRYRCVHSRDRSRSSMPTVVIRIDGVLANVQQMFLDYVALQGIPEYSNILHWLDLTCEMPLLCDICPLKGTVVTEIPPGLMKVIHNLRSTPLLWTSVPAFDDVDFSEIESAMDCGKFAGYFIASRFGVQTGEGPGDPRYLTRAWLDMQGIHSYQGILSDICQAKALELFEVLDADYILTDRIDAMVAWRQAGYQVYMLDRPWNQTYTGEFKVASVSEFIAIVTESDTNNR